MNDKSLFFLTLSLICVWIIIDNIIGHKYLNTFLSNMFDFIPKTTTKKEDKKEDKNNTDIIDDDVNYT